MGKTNGLARNAFSRKISWAVDNLEYAYRLPREAKEWLSKFNAEYYNGAVKKGDSTALHSSDELRKSCYKAKNDANSDVYSVALATCRLIYREAADE